MFDENVDAGRRRRSGSANVNRRSHGRYKRAAAHPLRGIDHVIVRICHRRRSGRRQDCHYVRQLGGCGRNDQALDRSGHRGLRESASRHPDQERGDLVFGNRSPARAAAQGRESARCGAVGRQRYLCDRVDRKARAARRLCRRRSQRTAQGRCCERPAVSGQVDRTAMDSRSGGILVQQAGHGKGQS